MLEEEKKAYAEIQEEEDKIKASTPEPLLSAEDEEFMEKEDFLHKKYGDEGVRAAAEAALSSATFGLSDYALKPLFGEALRERRERNALAAGIGEVGGIVIPALFSGGSSLLGKALPAAWAARGGLAVEKLTAKGISKLIAETGKKKFAKDVMSKMISKGAGSAVEAAFHGGGQLLEEHALGYKEFNAENLLAYGGKAALWGGLIGGGLGGLGKTVSIVVPKIKGNKVVGSYIKKIDNMSAKMTNPTYNVMKLGGFGDEAIEKLTLQNGKMVKNIPNVVGKAIEKRGVAKSLSSNKSLLKASEDYLDDIGKKIGKTVKQIDDEVIVSSDYPQMRRVAARQSKELRKLKEEFVDASGNPLSEEARKSVIKIRNQLKALENPLKDTTHLKASALQADKIKLHKLSNWGKKAEAVNTVDKIHRAMAKGTRDTLEEFSYKLNTSLGKELRQDLLNYNSLSTWLKGFNKQINTQTNFFNKRDIFMGLSALAAGINPLKAYGLRKVGAMLGKAQLKNKFGVMVGIEKANQTITKRIKKGIGIFFKGTKRRAVVPVAANLLVKSPLAVERKEGISVGKPKDDQEAIKNILTNFDYVRENPEAFERIMMDPNLEAAAPETYKHAKEIAGRALLFLDRKMPRTASKELNVNPFLRKTFPSSDQEIYRFKKYLNAVQNPMAVIKDLEHGNLSSEGVESLQFVYPDIYSRIQTAVFEELDRTGKEGKVEYPQRLQLGVLMGMPTDMALFPQAIQGLQALYKEAQVSQAGGTITAAAANKLDLAESQATELEKVSNRKDLNRA